MGVVRPWAAFARDPADSNDQRVEKVSAFIVASACCIAGVVWTAMYCAVFGWGLIASFPLAFDVLVGSALVVSHLTRDHRYAVYAQIVCIIFITAAIQWSIGGIFESGLVVVWAFLGPITALVFFSRREAVVWFVVYVAVLAVTVAFNGTFAAHGQDVSETVQLVFVAMNLGASSTVVFAFAGYFVWQAVSERARANRLLLNVLPAQIAATLKESDDTIAEHFDSASVLFADIVGSTPLFAELDPVEAVDWLNEVFSMFDALTETYGLEKIRTIGDNYMVAAGVPVTRADHASAIVRLGLDMVDGLERIPTRHGRRLQFRIGVSSGPMVGGVIGTHKFHYDVWGDTVNTASRMESHGEVGRVQISEATFELLGPGFECEPRGVLEIKGKGPMRTWFVARSVDRALDAGAVTTR